MELTRTCSSFGNRTQTSYFWLWSQLITIIYRTNTYIYCLKTNSPNTLPPPLKVFFMTEQQEVLTPLLIVVSATFLLLTSVLNKGGDFQLQTRLQPLLQNIGQLVVNQTPLFSSHDFASREPPSSSSVRQKSLLAWWSIQKLDFTPWASELSFTSNHSLHRASPAIDWL